MLLEYIIHSETNITCIITFGGNHISQLWKIQLIIFVIAVTFMHRYWVLVLPAVVHGGLNDTANEYIEINLSIAYTMKAMSVSP